MMSKKYQEIETKYILEQLNNALYFTISKFNGSDSILRKEKLYTTTCFTKIDDFKAAIEELDKKGHSGYLYYVVSSPYNLTTNLNGFLHLL
jgi:hypothetical protein